jgi:WD40 repeat protein
VRVLKAADAKVEDLAFSPDGCTIAAATLFNGIFLWNLESVPPSHVRVDSNEGYKKGGLSFSSDGCSLAWYIPGIFRRVYDRNTLRISKPNAFASNKQITFTPDGVHGISLHGIPEHRLYCWKLKDEMWVSPCNFSTAECSVECLTLSPDGSIFAMLTRPAMGKDWVNNPRKLEIRSATSANAPLLGTGEYPYKVEAKRLLFSPDARQLVGFNNMNLLVWRLSDSGDLGEPLLIRNTSRKQFTAMAFHSSGRHLYVTSNGEDNRDATVHVFDTTTWTRVEQFTWHLGNLKAVAVSQDGMLAAAGSDRGDIVIWDVDL